MSGHCCTLTVDKLECNYFANSVYYISIPEVKV